MTTKTQKKIAQLNGSAKPPMKKKTFEFSWLLIREIFNSLYVLKDFEETSMRALIKISYNCKVIKDKLKDLEAKEEPLNKLIEKLDEKFQVKTEADAVNAPKEYKTEWKNIDNQYRALHDEVEKIELELIPNSDFPGDSKEDRKKFPTKVVIIRNQPKEVSQAQAYLELLMNGIIVDSGEQQEEEKTQPQG